MDHRRVLNFESHPERILDMMSYLSIDSPVFDLKSRS